MDKEKLQSIWKTASVAFMEVCLLSNCCFKPIKVYKGKKKEIICCFCNTKCEAWHRKQILEFFENELNYLCKGRRKKDDVLFNIQKLIDH